jgi:hypothetical protein
LVAGASIPPLDGTAAVSATARLLTSAARGQERLSTAPEREAGGHWPSPPSSSRSLHQASNPWSRSQFLNPVSGLHAASGSKTLSGAKCSDPLVGFHATVRGQNPGGAQPGWCRGFAAGRTGGAGGVQGPTVIGLHAPARCHNSGGVQPGAHGRMAKPFAVLQRREHGSLRPLDAVPSGLEQRRERVSLKPLDAVPFDLQQRREHGSLKPPDAMPFDLQQRREHASIKPPDVVYSGPSAPSAKRTTLRTLRQKYAKNEPLTMVTAYDYPSAVHVGIPSSSIGACPYGARHQSCRVLYGGGRGMVYSSGNTINTLWHTLANMRFQIKPKTHCIAQ